MNITTTYYTIKKIGNKIIISNVPNCLLCKAIEQALNYYFDDYFKVSEV